MNLETSTLIKFKTGKPKNHMTNTTFSKHDIGCILDCSSDSADNLNARTVALAVEYGMELSADDRKLLARHDYDVKREDDAQWLSELGDEAVEYLNGLDLPAHCSFYFEDNSLFLYPCIESVREDVPCFPDDDQDEPDADYEGEWLSVNDHGNCTLYIRRDGKDEEIWAIV